jgi:hypothetical protein
MHRIFSYNFLVKSLRQDSMPYFQTGHIQNTYLEGQNAYTWPATPVGTALTCVKYISHNTRTLGPR